MRVVRRAFVRIVGGTWPVVPLVVVLCVTAFIGTYGTITFERDVILTLVSVVLVVGLYNFVGNSGILSFGHTSFMLIGAYGAMILTLPATRKEFVLPGLPEFIRAIELGQVSGAVVCGLLAAAFACVIAVPITRLVGIAAALGLFAVFLALHVVVSNWETVTRGTLGVFGVPRNTTLPVALVYASVAVLAGQLLKESRLGLRLRASRDEEVAARAVGVHIERDRGIALIVSAFWVGVGGFLYAQFLGAFGPNTFYLDITFITIAMLVIGGQHSLSGAVIGVILVSFLRIGLRSVEDGMSLGVVDIPARPGVSAVALGLVLLITLVVRPGGVTNGREIPLPGVLARAMAREAEQRAPARTGLMSAAAGSERG